MASVRARRGGYDAAPVVLRSDAGWAPEYGGALELYPLDDQAPDSCNSKLQGVPAATPSQGLLPTFNTMAMSGAGGGGGGASSLK